MDYPDDDSAINRPTKLDYKTYLDLVNGLYLDGVIKREDLDIFGFDTRSSYSHEMVLPQAAEYVKRERLALMSAILTKFISLGSFDTGSYYNKNDFNAAMKRVVDSQIVLNDKIRRQIPDRSSPMYSTWPLRPLSKYSQDPETLLKKSHEIQTNWLYADDDSLCKEISYQNDQNKCSGTTHLTEVHAENPFHDIASYKDRHIVDNLTRTIFHLCWQDFIMRKEDERSHPHLSGDDVINCAAQILPAEVIAKAQLAYVKLKEHT